MRFLRKADGLVRPLGIIDKVPPGASSVLGKTHRSLRANHLLPRHSREHRPFFSRAQHLHQSPVSPLVAARVLRPHTSFPLTRGGLSWLVPWIRPRSRAHVFPALPSFPPGPPSRPSTSCTPGSSPCRSWPAWTSSSS